MIKPRPFDWFICSVLGYLCCPVFGICAIYYAVRVSELISRQWLDVRIHNGRLKATHTACHCLDLNGKFSYIKVYGGLGILPPLLQSGINFKIAALDDDFPNGAARLTKFPEVPGSKPGRATYFRFSFR